MSRSCRLLLFWHHSYEVTLTYLTGGQKPTLNSLWVLFRPQISVSPPYDKTTIYKSCPYLTRRIFSLLGSLMTPQPVTKVNHANILFEPLKHRKNNWHALFYRYYNGTSQFAENIVVFTVKITFSSHAFLIPFAFSCYLLSLHYDPPCAVSQILRLMLL